MSGPKDDSVAIERRIQRELARQRQLELERLRRIEEERKQRVKKLQNNYANLITDAQSKIKKLTNQISSFNDTISEYEINATEELNKFISNVKSKDRTFADYPKFLTTENEIELNNKISDIKNFISSLDFSSEITDVQNSINQSYSSKLMNEISELSKKIQEEEKIKKEQEAAIKLKQEQELQQKKQAIQKAKEEILTKIEDAVTEFDNLIYIPTNTTVDFEKIKLQFSNIKDTATNDYLKNFYSISVLPTLKKFRNEVAEYQALANEYNEKIITYSALCQELKINRKDFPVTRDALVFLQAEIDRLNKIGETRCYESYIQQSINEVMSDMGYKVLGNLKDKSEGILETKLYQFDHNTAVSVTIDSYGDICMELGGMDENDRDPDMNEAIALKADMELFCTKHKEIKERLAQKGVILTRKHELPPDVEYAQIFNLNDFNIEAEQKDEILQTNSTNISHNELQHRTIE